VKLQGAMMHGMQSFTGPYRNVTRLVMIMYQLLRLCSIRDQILARGPQSAS
jgi:hypothetical protein